jgi:RNA polymerase sigma-70 factor (ECF subfamily)
MQSTLVDALGTAVPDETRANLEADAASADVRLVQAAQRGDRAAFGQLYASYAAMVHGILLSRVPPDVAEDLVQEAFLRAMPKLASLREPSHFGGWLAAIARNCAVDFLRRTRPSAEFDEELHTPAAAERPTDEDRSLDSRQVLDAIRSLPEAYRETLILRLVEGLTGPEIARKTGLTHGSVRVNLCRGLQHLRERLERRTDIALHARQRNEAKG